MLRTGISLLLIAACALVLRAEMSPRTPLDNIHTHILPDVLVKGSRRFTGYRAFFSWNLGLSRDGRRALTGDKNDNVVLWDVAAGKMVRVMSGHKNTAFDVALTPDGKTALSTGLDGTLRWWDADTGKPLQVLEASTGTVISLALSYDGELALTGAGDGAVKLWDVPGRKLLKVFTPGDGQAVVAAELTRDRRRAVTVEMNNGVKVWDVPSGKLVREAYDPPHTVRGGFVSPDGKSFLYGGQTLKLVDLETGALIRSYPNSLSKDETVISAAFSPDGKLFIAEDGEYMFNLFETATGKLKASYALGDHALRAVFMPGGKSIIASVGSDLNDGAVVVWPLDGAFDKTKRRYVPYPKDPAQEIRSQASAALGKLLFFDKRLSRDGTISCSSCHDPHKGWADGRSVAIGVGGRKGRRNAMTILNASAHFPLFWDGRASRLEEQAGFPLRDPDEMGSSPELAASHIAPVPGYKPYFREAFGDENVTGERIVNAVVEFERTLVSHDSPYDRYAAGDQAALDDAQRRGKDVFFGQGLCFGCHRLDTNSGGFINAGRKISSDLGRYEVTKDPKDKYAFTAPDLHSLRYTAPYFHDGSLATLQEVVEFYDRGGDVNPGKEFMMSRLGLTARQKKDLVSFLESLSGDPHVIDAPKLPE